MNENAKTVEVARACTCALRPFPHYHNPDTERWLKRI
jgi:hypothetical protein